MIRHAHPRVQHRRPIRFTDRELNILFLALCNLEDHMPAEYRGSEDHEDLLTSLAKVQNTLAE